MDFILLAFMDLPLMNSAVWSTPDHLISLIAW